MRQSKKPSRFHIDSTGVASSLDPTVKILPNGVRLVVTPMPHLSSASVGVFVRSGSRDEDRTDNGISHFLEHMAFKGTASRDVQAINLDAEMLGAEINAFTDKDTTCYFMEGLGEHSHQMLDMLADIVLRSTFPAQEIERERQVILQEATEYDEDPQQLAMALLDRALWGDHPIGQLVIGSPDNITRFSRADLVEHVRRHYVGKRIVVAAAGAVDAASFVRQAEALFSSVPAGDDPALASTPSHVGDVLVRRMPGVSQVFVNIAWPSVSRAVAPHLASLAATLFGGGMSSPLVDSLRERMGLAYTVGASAEVGDSYGVFGVETITSPEHLHPLSQELARLLHQHARAIEDRHLERARNQLCVALVTARERPMAMMQRSVEQLWVHGHLRSVDESIEIVRSFTANEVRFVFEQMLAASPAVVMVGRGASVRAGRQIQRSLTETRVI